MLSCSRKPIVLGFFDGGRHTGTRLKINRTVEILESRE